MISLINSYKTIGIFMCNITGDTKKELCRNIDLAAKHFGINAIIFSFVGTIGADYESYGAYEYKMLDVIPFDQLDGIILENSNIFTKDMLEQIYARVRKCSCPIVTISELLDEFYGIEYDNALGIKEMVKHFVEDHGFTRIGYMSGLKGHHDAVDRLNAFQSAMKEYGLPENGAGVFHGDFWHNMSKEAADFFWNKCDPRPEAIICANDFMALSLCDNLVQMGVNVPDDVCISGFDGIIEGKLHFPSITTIIMNIHNTIFTVFEMILNIIDGKEQPKHITLRTENRYAGSCGCIQSKGSEELRQKNNSFFENVNFMYHIYDTEAAMLEMNLVSDISQISDTFAKYSCNIGKIEKFFFMAYMSNSGKLSYESELTSPSDTVFPAIWIDRSGTSVKPANAVSVSEFIPHDCSDKPCTLYVTSIHLGDHCFGYTVMKMESEEPINEFYNIWITNIAVSLETLLHRNSIRRLVENLEAASTHDRLTDMLNRRGFEMYSHKAYEEAKNHTGRTVAAIVIDMDRLKAVNDMYGHAEGDYAIRALGHIISDCCTENETAGRTGGDEFYVFAPDYSEEKAAQFESRLTAGIENFNRTENKPYTLSASCGIYLAPIGAHSSLEEFLKHGDEKMYKIKRVRRAECPER